MLVRFSSESSYVDYLGSVASELLKMMGTSGKIPGAVDQDHLNLHLENLKTELEHLSDVANTAEDSDEIPLNTRAKPLIDLMVNAVKNNEYVMWDYS